MRSLILGGAAMTTTRASVSTLLATVRSQVEREAREAAGSNNLLSKAEEQKLTDGLLKAAAAQVRAEAGPGATVTVDRFVEAVAAKLTAAIGQVNQASGPGAAVLSQAEVKALAAYDRDVAARVAQAYEIVTGTRIKLDDATPALPVDPVVPPRPAVVGDLHQLMPKALELVTDVLAHHAGPNGVFNEAERNSLPVAFLRDAAIATPPPRSVANVVATVFSAAVDPLLVQVGAGPGIRSTDPRPLTEAHLVELVGRHQDIAGLLADTVMHLSGQRPNVLGLAPIRFVGPPAPPPPQPPAPPPAPVTPGPTPPSGARVLHNVPGATGVVTLIDPARVDELMRTLEKVVPLMDLDRTGTVSLREAQSFVRKLNGGAFPTDPQYWTQTEHASRAIFFAREEVYRRTRSNPTPAQILTELRTFASRVKSLGTDERNMLFDRSGQKTYPPTAILPALFDAARSLDIQLHSYPWLALIDHEGDLEPAKRRALDLSGPPKEAVRELVFHFNKAGNDNHWPAWSGMPTSRYRLDVDEVTPLLARLEQEPVTKQRELFSALVDWLQSPSPGMVYVNLPARPLIDALAARLGHPYRSPQGDWPAPRLPPP